MPRTSLTAEGIAEGLGSGYQHGQGWMACCPAHEDRNPSLSLTDGENGPLVHCHAGCPQGDVIEALRQRGLWQKSETEPPQKTTYIYRHEDGTPAFHVHRTDCPGSGKKIVQQLPNGQWKAPPAPRPLYNLPLIVSNPQEPVLVVEGEKTADAAAVIFPVDWVVITSAGGSKAAKQSDWSVLKGRQVLIWPDNDSPGRRYAEDVKRLCEAAGAARASIFSYPTEVAFPAGWDLADPLPEGFTLPPAEELTHPPPKPEPVKEQQRGFQRTAWREFKYQESERVEWVVDGLLRRGGMSLLVAPPKAGKSKFARNVARAVLLGEDCLDRPTTWGPCIYMAMDEGDVPPREHFKQMGLPDDAPLEIVTEREPEDALRKLAEMIEDVQPNLVVVDLLYQLLGDKLTELNEYGKVAKALQPLLDITRQCSAHVMLLHHARKSGGRYGEAALGSQALRAFVDITLSIERGEHYRSISSEQRMGTPLEDIILRLDETTGLIEPGGTKRQAVTQQTAKEIRAFLTEQNEPISTDGIKGAMGIKQQKVSDALRWLRKSGKVNYSGTGKSGSPRLYWVGDESVPESLVNGANPEKDRERTLCKNPEGIDPGKKSIPLFPTYTRERGNEHAPTIADHVDHLSGEACDTAIRQLVSEWFGEDGVEVSHSSRPSHEGQDLKVATPRVRVWLHRGGAMIQKRARPEE